MNTIANVLLTILSILAVLFFIKMDVMLIILQVAVSFFGIIAVAALIGKIGEKCSKQK